MKSRSGIRALATGALLSFCVAVAQEDQPVNPTSFELLAMPSDVAFDRDGQTYIVDSGNHQIAVFGATGLKTLTLGMMGEEEGQLMNPLGIGISRKDEAYVADKGNNRIVMFDSRGRARKHFEIQADGEDVVPIDIAVGPKGRELFITDNANHRVVVTNARGEFLRAWGSEGADDGQFRFPATIDIDGAGNVYVVDVLNARVQKFDPAGTHLLTIGQLGGKAGTFYRPKGVAVDEAGNIYVSDSFLGAVQVFTPDGEFHYVINDNGETRVFETPVGLAAGGGKLYVTEMLPGRVSIVEPAPPPPPPEEGAAE
jgi:DNA-binding beta-propeller fold protein YncE